MDERPNLTDGGAGVPTSAGRLRHVSDWLRASPTELVGLVTLLAGALVLTGVLFWEAGQRPDELSPAALIGDPGHTASEVPAGGLPRGAAPSASGAASTQGTDDFETLTVHVSGAVGTAGVVQLPVDARVADAIAAAGGASAEADVGRLNLARPLLDGERVHVPTPNEDRADQIVPGIVTSGAMGPDGRLDVNRATATELEGLPGIGPTRAAAIVQHRDSTGYFEVPGDLRAVPGIGEATFQQLADLITTG